jgi:hypothetical protein
VTETEKAAAFRIRRDVCDAYEKTTGLVGLTDYLVDQGVLVIEEV